MNKTLYLESKLKYLKQEYNELVEALNKEPQRYDGLKRQNYNALYSYSFPRRTHFKCSCGNDKFYRCNRFICSKCFSECYVEHGWEVISPEEKIVYCGIEIKAEEE